VPKLVDLITGSQQSNYAPMKKNFGGPNFSKKTQPKKLQADFVNVSNGMNDYKMNLIETNRTNKLTNPRRLTSQNAIKNISQNPMKKTVPNPNSYRNSNTNNNTIQPQRGPIKLNPKYTFNLQGFNNIPDEGVFRKKQSTNSSSYTPSRTFPYNEVKSQYRPPIQPKRNFPGSNSQPQQSGPFNRYPPTSGNQYTRGMNPNHVPSYPKRKTVPNMGDNSRYAHPNKLYNPRPKSGTIGGGGSWNTRDKMGRTSANSNSSRYSNASSSSILRTGKSPGGNNSVLMGRQHSPMNPLQTKVFMDTSLNQPRNIRLPNSKKPNILQNNSHKKNIILNKAQFYKKSAKKIHAEIITEEDKRPTKNRYIKLLHSKEARESHGKITSRLINELVTENKEVEKEYRDTSRIRKKQEQIVLKKEMTIPELDTSSWDKLNQVNINNINTFGLDKHDRFPTGHKFSLKDHKANDGDDKPNWLMSKYNKLFGKEQYKNTEFTMPKELKNYAIDYQEVKGPDLKKLLVKEQIEGSFDHFLLIALMEWTPSSNRRQKGLNDSFDRLEEKQLFGNSKQPVRRKDQSKVKALYWKQKEVYENHKITREELRELRNNMKEAKDTLNIIKYTAKQTRFQKRNQEINFSPEEIKKFFTDSNHERLIFFFKKYRGILVTEDIHDNVIFIENQFHGVEDQLNSKMYKQRMKNMGREKLFQNDSEKYARKATALIKKVKLMRETLRVAKNVSELPNK
jgi:hypothetical protein